MKYDIHPANGRKRIGIGVIYFVGFFFTAFKLCFQSDFTLLNVYLFLKD